MNWVDPLIESYYKFLRDKTQITPVSNEWIEVSTPFIGLFNDTINFYIKLDTQSGCLTLSDDGQTFDNLELIGAQPTRSHKRKEILDRILLNYGVTLHERELCITATEKNFPQKKLNFLSAIAEVNDLYVLAKNTVAGIFQDDVRSYLTEQAIVYTPFFISKGTTGLEFTFDFQLAGLNSEVLIKSFNSITLLNLPNFLFTWDDVKQARERQSQKKVSGLAIINDEKGPVKPEFLEALSSKGADFILWSERHNSLSIGKLRAA